MLVSPQTDSTPLHFLNISAARHPASSKSSDVRTCPRVSGVCGDDLKLNGSLGAGGLFEEVRRRLSYFQSVFMSPRLPCVRQSKKKKKELKVESVDSFTFDVSRRGNGGNRVTPAKRLEENQRRSKSASVQSSHSTSNL